MARKYSKKASAKVERAMKKRKAGTLKSGRSGRKVRSRKQAIAIGLSEARASGAKVPKKASKKEDRQEARAQSEEVVSHRCYSSWPGIAAEGRRRLRSPMPGSSMFPFRLNRARTAEFIEADQADLGRPALFAKIFPFSADPNHLHIRSRLVPLEGRIAIVTDAGRDAVDADGAVDEQRCDADGEVVWS